MCGIAGILGPEPERVRSMVRTLAHRGPDHQADWVDDGLGLGHARLSILDLSHAAHQPFVDPATGAVLVYNGEIYNFRELREELRSRGATFRTASDTEVILQGYLLEGIPFLSRLNGIFAFALLDPHARAVVLCRDPMGVKPLYLHERSGLFSFASEAKALYALLPAFRLDAAGLAGYLRFHYTPGLQTLVEGIRRFPPGEAWVVALDGTVRERHPVGQAWTADGGTPLDDPKALWSILDRAVQRQMVADVPVGSFLSGGIDSSVVTHLAARHTEGRLHTYSVGFDHGLDERPLAARFAEGLGCDHRDLVVRGEDARREMGAMSWHYDGPLGEGGCIPTYFVSQLAARSVKVVLAGEGADELFGGYPWYRLHRRLERMARWVPKGGFLERLPPLLLGKVSRTVAPLCRKDSVERYSALLEILGPEELRQACLPVPALAAPRPKVDAMALDRETLLRDCFLVKADTMTMAHGLEERVPFLDRDVVQAASRVPLDLKLGPPEKRILREAAKPHLPPTNVQRTKRGYGTPMTAWAQGVFRDGIQASLREPAAVAAGLVDAPVWDALASHVRRPTATNLSSGWLLYALDAWVAELVRRGVVADHP